MPLIVQHGILKPGTKNPGTSEADGVRCGSRHGAGIYSSPSADFSLSYTHSTCQPKPSEFFGQRLIARSPTTAPTHVATRELEYIVFDSAQIIPVFVMHIGRCEENAEHFESPPPDLAQQVVVEEVTEVDEDEEGYGEYQTYRGLEAKDKSNVVFWNWVKVGEEEDAARYAKSQGLLSVGMRMSTHHMAQ
ncbi:hypothetical protein DL762_006025 [Monosporascus cannonballus]|uniref:PARP catalytic domain-containing protein n=1 Tax=Monosporascus cannonballus TaxID=155416 RepID=A0ABY0H392_9PEZI|nr:hypothetical protein DL762_006025 [Monosporascus cannonballus]